MSELCGLLLCACGFHRWREWPTAEPWRWTAWQCQRCYRYRVRPKARA